ncbi:hypothetical protein B0H11DRAFT_2233533 [Mycena galericulata]|nr:hypothetical protein B0H11DRAFT_2233533 [Mycena galericulata]
MAGISTPATWLASAACIFITAGIVWQRACKSRPEWIRALDTLGVPRKQKLPGTAIVCGGSIAGIVTARVLADHYEKIILVDPEIEDEKPQTRIMQLHALHAFLSLFVDGARRLWPNFDAELEAYGGRFVPADTQIHYSGIKLLTPYQDYPPGCLPDTLVIRRSTAQKALHKVFMQHPTAAQITVVPGTVRGVTTSRDKTSVESVIVRKPDGTEVTLNDVALVADCTGMIQAGLKWLKTAGVSLPENIRRSYNGNLRYVTTTFAVSPELESTLPLPEFVNRTLMVYGFASHFDLGSAVVGLIKTDNNTMQLLIGDSGDGDLPRVPSDFVPYFTGFRGHAAIPSWFIDTIGILCESGDPVLNYIKIPPQSYVQYHSLPAGILPSNFVAIGDSNLQLNPIHGQGFGKIILNALALNSLLNTVDNLKGLPKDFSGRYFKNNATNTQSLWDATRLHDYGSPTSQPMEGETHDTGRLVRWFELKLISAATRDEEVASALWHVRHLLAADKVLLAPTTLWKILWTPSLF